MDVKPGEYLICVYSLHWLILYDNILQSCLELHFEKQSYLLSNVYLLNKIPVSSMADISWLYIGVNVENKSLFILETFNLSISS